LPDSLRWSYLVDGPFRRALTASASGAQSINPQVLDDSQLKAMTTTIGGADVLPSTRTVPHCSAKR